MSENKKRGKKLGPVTKKAESGLSIEEKAGSDTFKLKPGRRPGARRGGAEAVKPDSSDSAAAVLELNEEASFDDSAVGAPKKKPGRRKLPYELLKSDTPPWRKKPDRKKKEDYDKPEKSAAAKPSAKRRIKTPKETVEIPDAEIRKESAVNAVGAAKRRGRKPSAEKEAAKKAPYANQTDLYAIAEERTAATAESSEEGGVKQAVLEALDDSTAGLAPGALKVLYAASEAGPFIKSGGLGDVAASLPKALRKNGVDIRIVMPLYHDIAYEYRKNFRYIGHVYVPLGWRKQYCGVFETRYDGVTYYFIDNEYYFKRENLYKKKSNIYGHYDDAERFAFFSKAILESMRVTGFYPDVLHVNDWQTALSPLFLNVFYRFGSYNGIRTVFTIHNIEYQGKYGLNVGEDVAGLDKNALKLAEYDKCFNVMKGAIETADAVTTVSESYSSEILDPFFADGLNGILNARKYKLSGIVNGIDGESYDPKNDKRLSVNYGIEDAGKRIENKRELLASLGLPEKTDRPLIGMVTRLTRQKGIDLLTEVSAEIFSRDLALIVLGNGDERYESALKMLENIYPDKIRAIVAFDQEIAARIYGGSDFFLMPSVFEPCGIGQLIAMRYGAVPIVRETGGLRDTVEAYNPLEGIGTGFTFKSINARDMLDAIDRAIDVYYKKDELSRVIRNAMSRDFSWNASAEKYEALYRSLK